MVWPDGSAGPSVLTLRSIRCGAGASVLNYKTMSKIKRKSKSAAKKRFKFTGGCNLLRGLANSRHKFVNKSTTYKNKSRSVVQAHKSDCYSIKRMLNLV